jgi:hypothetical protein
MENEPEQHALEALENASQQCEGGFCPMPNQVQPVPGIRYDLPGKQVMFDQENMSTEERQNELWAAFEAQPKIMQVMAREYTP